MAGATVENIAVREGKAMDFWLKAGGFILGGFSVFKLVQRLTQFGLAPIFADLITFYKTLFYPLGQLVNAVVTSIFTFENVPEEIPVLYFLIGAAMMRAQRKLQDEKPGSRVSVIKGARWEEDQNLFKYSPMLFFCWPLYILVSQELLEWTAIEICILFGSFLAFFALNAYAG